MEALRKWGASKPRFREFPLLWPFTAMLVAGGVSVYYGGRSFSRKQNENYREKVDAHLRKFSGEADDDAADTDITSTDILWADESSNSKRGLTLGALAATSVGVMLYKNWNSKSIAMSLMHTRVLAQACVLGGVGILSLTSILDNRKKSDQRLHDSAHQSSA
eukprot:CAMPEP_0198730838 /NCGR_PEP_ID=MMETSP1475-20131203/26621_1 /TAXON_ID= ORGANISM="Unidentified sp., Strain CCMP1999" /NCGR_SAMPLE_ID=MMETSP1475 /ASSEMBLY_ACC=CAM_ASM_001111 /LENGTH=161 /DNA_ID=CAMNT_0044493705 /DNA_START=208 /DNA_END=693 /DNA_ORIENTATION=+